MSTELLVDAEAVKKAFEGNSNSAISLYKKFPSSYRTITEANQKLKTLQFDLANTVTDVQNLASSTKTNAERGLRKLALR
jgi:hypothetical protein